MTQHPEPPIDVDELLRRVRREVERRGRSEGDDAAFDIALPRMHGRPRQTAPRGDWTLRDLLAFEDEDFVDAAYVAAVGRGPDPAGRAHFLDALRAGTMNKTDIVGRLRYSPEGRAKRRRVRGLFVPFAWRTMYRVPVLGYVLALGSLVLRLPTVARNIEAFENHSRLRLRTVEGDLAEHARVMEDTLGRARDVLGEVARSARGRETASRVELLAHDLDALRDELARDVDAIRVGAEASAGLLEGRLLEALAPLEAGKADTTRVDDINARLLHQEQTKADAAALMRIEERVGLLAGSQLDRAALEAHLRAIEERIATKAGQGELASLQERVVGLAEAKADRLGLELLRTQIEGRLAGLADGEATRAALARLERFIDDVRLATRSMRASAPPQLAAGPAGEQAPALPAFDADAFYVELETAFRGTREQIMLRAEAFLAAVADAQAGTVAAPLLDLGCGRGEWLELLGERGLVARGVDLNPLFVEACRERSLDVVEGDALAALRALPDASLGAVSAFHLVEHLPFEVLMAVLDESRRVLKPGGVLILETPNPENLSVGACSFYLDPTHRNPIPPALLEFLVRSRGIPRTEIRRLHEHRITDPFGALPEEITRVPQLELAITLLRQAYYSAPDYAVVGHTG